VRRAVKIALLGAALSIAVLASAHGGGSRKPDEGQARGEREVNCGERCRTPCTDACRPILWEGEDCQQCLRDLQRCKADCEAAKKKDVGS